MRTLQLHTLDELTPEARARAFETYKTRVAPSIPVFWEDEIFESLKATVSACGFACRDWSLGHSWDRGNYLTVAPDPYNSAARRFQDSNGALALGYVWHRVLKPAGYARPALPGYKVNFTGLCPFTGYCADDDYLEALWANLLGGRDLRHALQDLADTHARLLDNEREYLDTEDAFESWAEGEEFEEDGTRY